MWKKYNKSSNQSKSQTLDLIIFAMDFLDLLNQPALWAAVAGAPGDISEIPKFRLRHGGRVEWN